MCSRNVLRCSVIRRLHPVMFCLRPAPLQFLCDASYQQQFISGTMICQFSDKDMTMAVSGYNTRSVRYTCVSLLPAHGLLRWLPFSLCFCALRRCATCRLCRVTIVDATSVPNKFKWVAQDGSTDDPIGITAGSNINIDRFVNVRFESAVGHTLNAEWTFAAAHGTVAMVTSPTIRCPCLVVASLAHGCSLLPRLLAVCHHLQ